MDTYRHKWQISLHFMFPVFFAQVCHFAVAEVRESGACSMPAAACGRVQQGGEHTGGPPCTGCRLAPGPRLRTAG